MANKNYSYCQLFGKQDSKANTQKDEVLGGSWWSCRKLSIPNYWDMIWMMPTRMHMRNPFGDSAKVHIGTREAPTVDFLGNGEGPYFLNPSWTSHVMVPYGLHVCILLKFVGGLPKPVTVSRDKGGDLKTQKWVLYPKEKWDCKCCFPGIWIHKVKLAVCTPGRLPGTILAG